MKDFKNKVAVITGAGSGIGRALACALAADGARLALSDIREQGLAETVGHLPAGTDARGYQLDVSSREAVFAHADAVKADFGKAHLLFNNAGTTLIGMFENQTIEEMRWLVEINLWGVIYGTKAFLPMMLAQREGCIVNVSSVFGLVGFPTHSAYNMTKFGVRGLTECLWSELDGTGVNAVCVHPGGINTGFEGPSRMAAAAGSCEQAMKVKAATLMLTTPAQCAAEILRGIRRGKRRIVTGQYANLLFWLPRLFPDRYPRFLKSLAP
jgi:NAD(P)-dependent dehydrogenase (short-subunit alcohol dehydrogenase family)